MQLMSCFALNNAILTRVTYNQVQLIFQKIQYLFSLLDIFVDLKKKKKIIKKLNLLLSSNEQHLFKIEIFCNIICVKTLYNIFTVSSDSFNVSFLNRNMNTIFLLTSSFWMLKILQCNFDQFPENAVFISLVWGHSFHM